MTLVTFSSVSRTHMYPFSRVQRVLSVVKLFDPFSVNSLSKNKQKIIVNVCGQHNKFEALFKSVEVSLLKKQLTIFVFAVYRYYRFIQRAKSLLIFPRHNSYGERAVSNSNKVLARHCLTEQGPRLLTRPDDCTAQLTRTQQCVPHLEERAPLVLYYPNRREILIPLKLVLCHPPGTRLRPTLTTAPL